MDHRITVAIIAVFGGTLAFTFFVVSLTQSVGPEGKPGLVLAADGAGDDAEAPTVSPRDQLVELLGRLDRSAAEWRRDHGGRYPDFVTYPGWEQFLQKTTADGKVRPDATGRSYLAQAPVNPLNKLGTVAVVDVPLRAADRVPAAVGRAGFVYSTADGCFWGTNGSGRVILARGAAQPKAYAPTTLPTAPPSTPASQPTTHPATAPSPAPAAAPELPSQ